MLRVLFLYILLILASCPALFSQGITPGSSNRLAPLAMHFRGPGSFRLLVGDSLKFAAWAAMQEDIKIVSGRRGLLSVMVENDDALLKLVKADGVQFVDRGDRIPHEETVLGDFDMTLNGITAVHALFPELSGEGITVSIKEKPFDTTDLDLRGRYVINDQFDEPSTLHATIMATVVAGAGNTTSVGLGAAPAALVTTSDFLNLLPDDPAKLNALGVTIQNHSYGVSVENYYGIESREYDKVVADNPSLLHVFSSGNDGDQALEDGYYANLAGFANLTGQFKLSKNTLTVGSTDRYGNVVIRSSRGPASDGRVKPEVVAIGDAGSSEAAAVVSGVATLIQDSYSKTFSELPPAALVKAIIINSATDTGQPHVDFDTGFGNVDALASIRNLNSQHFLSDALSLGGQKEFFIDVPSSQHELKITLAWTDEPGDPSADHALVNDLDLEVISPSGEVFLPWVLNTTNSLAALQATATRGVDHLNNVEQVTIDVPETGNYTIRVKGSAVSSLQNFFVAYDWFDGFELLFPTSNDVLEASVNAIIRWSWHETSTTAAIEFKFHSDEVWQTIGESVDLSAHYLEWTPPDTSALIDLRFNMNGEYLTFEKIVLDNPQRLQVGFDCEDEAMLQWRSVPAATEYVLFRLDSKYLEPALVTSDTFALIDKSLSASQLYSLAARFEDKTSVRERTIDYANQGVGCYFRSFLPQLSYVFDRALFSVELGTIYHLKSASLQVLKGQTFETIEVIEPITATSFSMDDPQSRKGMQFYRVVLETQDGNIIVSNEEHVLFVGPSDVYLHPNPAWRHEDVSVIVQDEEVAQIEICDTKGILIHRYEDVGIAKVVATSTLDAGLYIIRVTTTQQKKLYGRLIVK